MLSCPRWLPIEKKPSALFCERDPGATYSYRRPSSQLPKARSVSISTEPRRKKNVGFITRQNHNTGLLYIPLIVGIVLAMVAIKMMIGMVPRTPPTKGIR